MDLVQQYYSRQNATQSTLSVTLARFGASMGPSQAQTQPPMVPIMTRASSVPAEIHVPDGVVLPCGYAISAATRPLLVEDHVPGGEQEQDPTQSALAAVAKFEARVGAYNEGHGDANTVSRFAQEVWAIPVMPACFVDAVRTQLMRCLSLPFGSMFPVLTGPDTLALGQYLWTRRHDSGIHVDAWEVNLTSMRLEWKGSEHVWHANAALCNWLFVAVLMELVRFWRRITWRRFRHALTSTKLKEIYTPRTNVHYGSFHTPHSLDPDQQCMACRTTFADARDGIQPQYATHNHQQYESGPKMMRRCFVCDGFVCHLCAFNQSWRLALAPPSNRRRECAEDEQRCLQAYGKYPGFKCDRCQLYVCHFCHNKPTSYHRSVSTGVTHCVFCINLDIWYGATART
jgi:hypothetical protein